MSGDVDSDDLLQIDPETLREQAAAYGAETADGKVAWNTVPASRSADRTYNAVDGELPPERFAAAFADAARQDDEMATFRYRIGDGLEKIFEYNVDPDYAFTALVPDNLFERYDGDETPDYVTWHFPGADEIAIYADPETGRTRIDGSPYPGEVKKSALRHVMYDAKEAYDGIGLHANCRRVDVDGGPVYQVMAGLSGTGKTTLALDADVIQEDVLSVVDGEVYGTERGMFFKTKDLDRAHHGAVLDALDDERTVLNNVYIDDDGVPQYDDDRISTNGRAAAPRDAVGPAAEAIDAPRIDQFVHIMRDETRPPIGKVSPEQSAALFALGKSMETGAADEDRIGESRRVFGYNPFVSGSREDEANRFYDMLREQDVDSFFVNTAYVGDQDHDISPAMTKDLLQDVAAGEIDWTDDDLLGYDVPDPEAHPELAEYHPDAVFDDAAAAVGEARQNDLVYLAAAFDTDRFTFNALDAV